MIESLVIALGGNAITRPGERGTIPQQFAHTRETLQHLVPLFRSERRIVITHGNGPQIGNILIRSEEGERRVPPLPLDTCVSDSQGGMGYMIQRVADEMFRREGIRRECATVITQVLVDRNDPDFEHPSKPVGSFHTTEELEKLRVDKPHWRMKEIEAGRWRRVVPSPRPIDILEKESIAAMLAAGVVVVACGGGGIPVAWDGERLVGVEGVIDKDLASCLLAKQVRANKLIIVTSVDQVAVSYRKPEQQWLSNLTIESARGHLDAGEFPRGSMGPKIEAAIDFLENGGEECIITSTEKCADAVEGNGGTHIVAAWGNRSLSFNAP
ncbi:MAG TPA: carbamate kinase [Terriglobales bacterium]|jgi:carbamate kinase|nr:carbamate kinase [Terriglobales bacterium]